MLKAIRRLLLLGLLTVQTLAAAGWWYVEHTRVLSAGPVSIEIRAGTSLRGIARQLEQAGLITWPDVFVSYARLRGDASRLKAGSYEFSDEVSVRGILDRIAQGDVSEVSITIPEGWTWRQLRASLRQHPHITPATPADDDAGIMAAIGFPGARPEGWFFPETYFFGKGSSEVDILRRAHRLMRKHLDREWSRRRDGLPLKSPEEALILASIVEKETGRAEERGLVAAVFLNRLRIGMRLQTDPTVIYGLGAAFDGNLRKRDLLTDTPYNTYTRAGLPPTPIAMPGLDSIRAVLQPPQSDALYFVARGDGSSHFSRTLAEHERAVTEFQRRRRK